MRTPKGIFASAKDFEREAARRMLKIDGYPKSPRDYALITSTGRLGDISRWGLDFLSRSYAGEVKSVVRNPNVVDPGHTIKLSVLKKVKENAQKYFGKPWLLVVKFAHWEEIHCISWKRHAWLLACERVLAKQGLSGLVKEEMKNESD